MFTGIVETLGVVKSVAKGAKSSRLIIGITNMQFDDVKIGDSICTNGVCLTVVEFTGSEFAADVMHQTFKHSSLGALKVGEYVNLERAMKASDRFGGHIVSGHIDGVGTVSNIKKEDIAIYYTIKADKSIIRYIVDKGSIAIDGISLTVASVNSNSFVVSIIPHTAECTTLSLKSVGSVVNLENDIIGKYVEKLLSKPSTAITKEFLLENGF